MGTFIDRETAMNLYSEVDRAMRAPNVYASEVANYRLRRFLRDYPNDKTAVEIRKRIGEYLYSLYDFDAIQRALLITDDLPYYKDQEIFKASPFQYNNHPLYVTEKILRDSYDYSISEFGIAKDLINEYCVINNHDMLLDGIDDFYKRHRLLINVSKKHYDDLTTEYNRLLQYDNNNCKMDEEEFNRLCEYRAKLGDTLPGYSDYRNHILGKTGELYNWTMLTYENSPKFIARDLCDGFGYDQSYLSVLYDGSLREELAEAKSTTTNAKTDCFYISDNEFEVLESTLLFINAHYTIHRVFIDKNNLWNSQVAILDYDLDNDVFYDNHSDLTYKEVPSEYQRKRKFINTKTNQN